MSQHRQFMNAKITEINNNYYDTWGINNQTSNLNSNIQSLEHEATQLGIRINEIRISEISISEISIDEISINII